MVPREKRRKPNLVGNVMVADGPSSKVIMELWAHLVVLALFFAAAALK
jgi:hypothetical protein